MGSEMCIRDSIVNILCDRKGPVLRRFVVEVPNERPACIRISRLRLLCGPAGSFTRASESGGVSTRLVVIATPAVLVKRARVAALRLVLQMVETLIGLERLLITISARGVRGLASKGGSDGLGAAGGLTGELLRGHVEEALAHVVACCES